MTRHQTECPAPTTARRDRLLLRLHLAALGAATILVILPWSSRALRLGLVLSLGLALLGLVLLLWSRRGLGKLLLATTLAAILLIALAPEPVPGSIPSAVFSERLESFLGTRYVWGGECGRGIDCSGLVRRGMVESLLARALAEASPGRLRQALDLWWHDASARHLGEGYDGRLAPIEEGRCIADIEAAEIRPGDLAVTRDGRHVLAHLGGNRWIQAQPRARAVIATDRGADDGYLRTPVRILRWTALSAP